MSMKLKRQLAVAPVPKPELEPLLLEMTTEELEAMGTGLSLLLSKRDALYRGMHDAAASALLKVRQVREERGDVEVQP